MRFGLSMAALQKCMIAGPSINLHCRWLCCQFPEERFELRAQLSMETVLYGINQPMQPRMLEADPFQTGVAQEAHEEAHRCHEQPHHERGAHDLPERGLRRKHGIKR